MKKMIVCTICPSGCIMEVGEDNEITGAKCERGIKYAEEELKNPTRVLTTTMRVRGGELSLVSVKTNESIPKPNLMEAMDVISQKKVDAPIKIGDILLKNLLGTGADVVATKEIDRSESK